MPFLFFSLFSVDFGCFAHAPKHLLLSLETFLSLFLSLDLSFFLSFFPSFNFFFLCLSGLFFFLPAVYPTPIREASVVCLLYLFFFFFFPTIAVGLLCRSLFSFCVSEFITACLRLVRCCWAAVHFHALLLATADTNKLAAQEADNLAAAAAACWCCFCCELLLAQAVVVSEPPRHTAPFPSPTTFQPASHPSSCSWFFFPFFSSTTPNNVFVLSLNFCQGCRLSATRCSTSAARAC